MSLPAGERKPGSVIPELLNHERQHGVKILCKASDYKALPDEWKKFTWASEDAIFPLLAVDDTVIWYGVPEFKGLFTDKNTDIIRSSHWSSVSLESIRLK